MYGKVLRSVHIQNTLWRHVFKEYYETIEHVKRMRLLTSLGLKYVMRINVKETV